MADREATDGHQVECRLDFLEPAWNLKVKSVTVTDAHPNRIANTEFRTPRLHHQISITFGFADEAGDLEGLRKAFRTYNAIWGHSAAERGNAVVFYLFDADGVVLQKVHPERLEGAEITGKVGDAFRAVFFVEPDIFKQTKKIEPRPVTL